MDKPTDEIVLSYAGMSIRHRITSEEVSEFTSTIFQKADQAEVKKKVQDSLMLLDMFFGINKRLGFAEVFGKNQEFRTFLLNKMKGAQNG